MKFDTTLFRRTWQVKVPAKQDIKDAQGWASSAKYSEKQRKHIASLLDPKTRRKIWTAEERAFLDEVDRLWLTELTQLDDHPLAEEGKKLLAPKFNFTRFCTERDLSSPTNISVTTAAEAKAAEERIVLALPDVPAAETRAHKILRGWMKEFSALRRRYETSYGHEDRRGPPASYLAKKNLKRAASAETRQKMQSPAGKK